MGRPRGYFRPGTRRRRWKNVSNIEGIFGLGVAGFAFYVASTNTGTTTGTTAATVFGLLMVWCAAGSFVSAKRGWPIYNDSGEIVGYSNDKNDSLNRHIRKRNHKRYL